MRILLFGTGAMSCLFAARLAAVAEVAILGAWADAINAIRSRGVLIDEDGKSRTVQVGAAFLGDELPAAELAIVLVKAWQTQRVADHLPSYLSAGGMAVSLQNGLGNVELLGAKAFPGSTSEGATLVEPGHVRAGGRGATRMVAPQWVVDLFRNAGFECYGCDPGEAESLLWGKLAISCGINALTALLRVPNGELLNRPNATDLMIRASEECGAIAGAKGIRLPFPSPADKAKEVARNTATNHSSMLQDMVRGAPTECDAINGVIVAEGKRLGIPTPVNEILWQLVRAAVHKNRRVFR
jgi:2-dehydropantoate 2-reductase